MSHWKLGLYHRRMLESGHDCAPGQRVIPTWEFYRQDWRKRFRGEDVCDFALDCAALADWMKHNPGRRLSEWPGRPVLHWTIRPLPADFWD